MYLTLYYGRQSIDTTLDDVDPIKHPDIVLECSDVIRTYGTIEVLFEVGAVSEYDAAIVQTQHVTGWDRGVRDWSLQMREVEDMVVVDHPNGTRTFYSDWRVSA